MSVAHVTSVLERMARELCHPQWQPLAVCGYLNLTYDEIKPRFGSSKALASRQVLTCHIWLAVPNWTAKIQNISTTAGSSAEPHCCEVEDNVTCILKAKH